MKKEKVIAWSLAAGLLFSMSACETEKQETEKPVNTTPEVTAEAEKEETPEAEETAEEEPMDEEKETTADSEVEEAPALLRIKLQEEYLSEWEGQELIYDSRYPVFSLEETEAEAYPGLAEALSSYSSDMEKDMKILKDTLFPKAKSAKKSFVENIHGELLRADSTVLSFLMVQEEYTGGRDSNLLYIGKNYDTVTGEELKLPEVVPEPDALPALICEILEEKYGDRLPVPVKEEDIAKRLEKRELSWTIGYQGLTVYFAPGEVNSRKAGLLTAEISFISHPEIFAEKYGKVPEQWAVSFGDPGKKETEIYADLDGDGTADRIQVKQESSGEEDEERYAGLTITTPEGSCTAEWENLYTDLILLHTGEKQNYLYAELMGDNDYSCIAVVNLAGSPEVVDETGSLGEESQMITDPQQMKLSSRLDLFSTYGAWRMYQVGEDGMPQPLTETFTIDADPEMYTLTTKREVPADLLDPETQEVRESGQMLPEGTKLNFLRTDGAHYVDFRYSGNKECRIYLDEDEDGWHHAIQGVDIQELFDGMRFAG